jgi:hypothetical protein
VQSVVLQNAHGGLSMAQIVLFGVRRDALCILLKNICIINAMLQVQRLEEEKSSHIWRIYSHCF